MASYVPVHELDPTVFANDLIQRNLLPSQGGIPYDHQSQSGVAQPTYPSTASSSIDSGTFKGTQKALTAAYGGLLNAFATYFDIAGFEVYLPRNKTDLTAAREIYTWSIPSEQDNYPPHLAKIPCKDSAFLTQIFNFLRLAETAPLVARVIPDTITDFFYDNPANSDSIQGVVDLNRTLRQGGHGVSSQPNIGDRDDWYSDAVFAQQQLTGTNPVTLEKALDWLNRFIEEASAQNNQAAVKLLSRQVDETSSSDSFYVQDFSWFRDAIKLDQAKNIQSDDGLRHTSAPVALFHLVADTGVLHPVAICLDFKGSLSRSVTLFNSRLESTDDTSSEREDWPWRYAKTVFQCADWHRHEVGVHLTESHLVEEATIVAANRAFPETHIVYQLLSLHWLKTLSVNLAARSSLVPNVIVPIAGMGGKSLYALARHIYNEFDFTGHYIPNDLERRGFPESQLQQRKYHNCAYARDISLFWNLLRKFVSTVLESEYGSDSSIADAAVAKAQEVMTWCKEMRDSDKGGMPGFPNITTLDQLIDAVTACIHIASPLHSAVNYLQNYYYAFVIHKPSALYTVIPETLDALNACTEQDLVDALPIHHARDWLIGSHVPWLLSYQVADNQNILSWAATLANTSAGNQDGSETVLSTAARTLHQDMLDLVDVIQTNSDSMDDRSTPYTVLAPREVAVSILI